MTTSEERLRQAAAHCQAGQFDAAEQICRDVLRTDLNASAAYDLLGSILAERGQWAEAGECFRRVASIRPTDALAHYNLATVLTRLDRPDEAIASYREALKNRPGFLEAQFNLGNLCRSRGMWTEALAAFDDVIARRPQFAEAHYVRGIVLQAQGQLAAAESALAECLRLKPSYADAHRALGTLLHARGQVAEGVQHLQAAVRDQPNSVAVLVGLGNALRDAQRGAEAAKHYEQALRIDPASVVALVNLGLVHQDAGRIEKAIDCQRRAIALAPDFALAHNSLGTALQIADDPAGAEAAYRRAIALAPNETVARHNLGMALLETGKLDEARRAFTDLLAIRPDDAEAHYWIGSLRLTEGDFAGGWPEYEWRLRTKYVGRTYPFPRWDGSELAGKKILVVAEWGLGDTFHFLRYVPLVEARGGQVVLSAQPALLPLLKESGYASVIAADATPPACDAQVQLLSLPRVFGTTLETIPANVPYVSARPALVEAWRERLSAYQAFKVGIHWHGSKSGSIDARSIPLTAFEPLARVPGVRLFSLQKNLGSEQLAEVGERFSVVDLGPELDISAGPFMDTAAVMKNLDLVVTCDTAVAHLAGALGVPVWVGILYSAEWRWLLEREDSPWYPTMRLFRQTKYRDWTSVMARMAAELPREMERRT